MKPKPKKQKKIKRTNSNLCVLFINSGLLVGYRHTTRRPRKVSLILELLMDIDKLI